MKSNAVKSYALDLDWSAQTMLPIELNGEELHLEARAYQGTDPHNQAFVLINRTSQAGNELPYVRVHSGCVTGDIFHSLKCDCYPQLQASMEKITTSPLGVLIYLPYHEGRGIGLVNKLRAYTLQDWGLDTLDANRVLGWGADERNFLIGANMLLSMGITKVRLLTNNPDKIAGLTACGVEVVGREAHAFASNEVNDDYLSTKKTRFGHLLE